MSLLMFSSGDWTIEMEQESAGDRDRVRARVRGRCSHHWVKSCYGLVASISSSLNWFFYLFINLSLRYFQLLYSSGDVVGGDGCCCCRCSGHGHCLFRSYFIIVSAASSSSSFLLFNFFAVRVFAVSSFLLSFIVPFFCYLVMFYFVSFLFDFFRSFRAIVIMGKHTTHRNISLHREIFQSVNEPVVWYGVLSSVMWPLLLLSIPSLCPFCSVRSLVRSFVQQHKHNSTYDLYYYVNSFHWTWDRNNNTEKRRK